jgi:hypothetical protein
LVDDVLNSHYNVALSDMSVVEEVSVIEAELHAAIVECIFFTGHRFNWPTPALHVIGDVVPNIRFPLISKRKMWITFFSYLGPNNKQQKALLT